MSLLPITLAAGPYDRTRALADGRVTVAGADLRYITLDPEEIFFRMVTHGEFDVSEMSMATYHVLTRQGRAGGRPGPVRRHPGLPVPDVPAHQRLREHRTHPRPAAPAPPAPWSAPPSAWPSGSSPPTCGSAASWPSTTACPSSQSAYRTGGLDAPGRHEKVALSPAGVDRHRACPGRTEPCPACSPRASVDATSTRRGRRGRLGTGSVRRLFADTRAEEERYFAATGIFPIMHVIVIRRDVYEANRWLPRELFKAFTAAKRVAYDDLTRTAALADLPALRPRGVRSAPPPRWAPTTGPTASSRTGPSWRRSPATPPPSTSSRALPGPRGPVRPGTPRGRHHLIARYDADGSF